MTYSLIACRQAAGHASALEKFEADNWQAVDARGWDILVRGLRDVNSEGRIATIDQRVCIVLGSPTNLSRLRSVATVFDSHAVSAPVVHVFRILNAALGASAFALVDGPFNYLEFSDEAVFAANDALGMQPLHVVHGQRLWLSSELKHIGRLEPGVFRFHPVEAVAALDSRADDYLPIDNARRLKPGSVARLFVDGARHASLNVSAYHVPRLVEAQQLAASDAKRWMAKVLTRTVQGSVDTDDRIFVPLSGGLDSSMVTSLASRRRADIETFALGTGRSNEFPFARIVADHLGTRHREIDFSTQDILNGVDQAIYHNEIFDGLSAEIQSTLMCFYRSVGMQRARVVTGYGSDLLFGGVLKQGDAPESINDRLWAQIYRTRWTGEFSPFGAAAYGLDVQHPFWRPEVIGFAASLAPALKLSERDVKIALRECAEECNLLPASIVWRRKIGIHEGSSVNAIFADHIGSEIKDYRSKTKYSYKKYMRYLSGEGEPGGNPK
ncbi:asparagine synthase family protein [Burkholderia gladioli]|uniref:asparagine synthase family protein n=1 Tax=Burkholderia gladioli TaxID=28095 RepID=UPI0022D32669|nr:carbapenam-3-carboxylate synthase domain-containing protein [Burkholderia gladioli]MDA0574070.1 asparagine synthetase B family protein [Burkholderia gladioli]MDA0602361.1 asparagine synthetase B family protein [Burkholderia gladioli]